MKKYFKPKYQQLGKHHQFTFFPREIIVYTLTTSTTWQHHQFTFFPREIIVNTLTTSTTLQTSSVYIFPKRDNSEYIDNI